jgi:hypothetical protein
MKQAKIMESFREKKPNRSERFGIYHLDSRDLGANQSWLLIISSIQST